MQEGIVRFGNLYLPLGGKGEHIRKVLTTHQGIHIVTVNGDVFDIEPPAAMDILGWLADVGPEDQCAFAQRQRERNAKYALRQAQRVAKKESESAASHEANSA